MNLAMQHCPSGNVRCCLLYLLDEEPIISVYKQVLLPVRREDVPHLSVVNAIYIYILQYIYIMI